MRMTYILIEGEDEEEKEDGNGKEINERKVIYIYFLVYDCIERRCPSIFIREKESNPSSS